VLFPEQSVASIHAAVDAFEAEPGAFSAAACRANAERFGIERFRDELASYLAEAVSRARPELGPAPR
jgi:hypothetical protein